MRRILFLIAGLLAASTALAPSASAHDYHRSKRAVEAPHARQHHAQPRRHVKVRPDRHVHRYCRDHRGRPRACAVKRHVHRHYLGPRHRPSFVIVISPYGHYRLARR